MGAALVTGAPRLSVCSVISKIFASAGESGAPFIGEHRDRCARVRRCTFTDAGSTMLVQRCGVADARATMHVHRCAFAGSGSGKRDDFPERMRAPARGAPSAGWTSGIAERNGTAGWDIRRDANQCVRTGTNPIGSSGRSRVRRRRTGNACRSDGLLRRIVETRPTRP